MKLLLTAINAKYIHSNLAVYSLRASAGSIRDQVKLAEFTINHRTEEILRDIYRKKPDVLFFSCYIWNMVYVTELTAECKKVGLAGRRYPTTRSSISGSTRRWTGFSAAREKRVFGDWENVM